MTKPAYKLNLPLIKEKREKLKMTQTQVAEAMGLPYDKYSRRESGDYKFKAEELPTLSKVLDLPIENFFIDDVAKTENKKEGVS